MPCGAALQQVAGGEEQCCQQSATPAHHAVHAADRVLGCAGSSSCRFLNIISSKRSRCFAPPQTRWASWKTEQLTVIWAMRASQGCVSWDEWEAQDVHIPPPLAKLSGAREKLMLESLPTGEKHCSSDSSQPAGRSIPQVGTAELMQISSARWRARALRVPWQQELSSCHAEECSLHAAVQITYADPYAV